MVSRAVQYRPRRRLRPWVRQAIQAILVALATWLALEVIEQGNQADDARIRQQIARWQSTYALANRGRP